MCLCLFVPVNHSVCRCLSVCLLFIGFCLCVRLSLSLSLFIFPLPSLPLPRPPLLLYLPPFTPHLSNLCSFIFFSSHVFFSRGDRYMLTTFIPSSHLSHSSPSTPLVLASPFPSATLASERRLSSCSSAAVEGQEESETKDIRSIILLPHPRGGGQEARLTDLEGY